MIPRFLFPVWILPILFVSQNIKCLSQKTELIIKRNSFSDANLFIHPERNLLV